MAGFKSGGVAINALGVCKMFVVSFAVKANVQFLQEIKRRASKNSLS